MMRMDYGLKLEMNQKLVMTPQLRQAIAILQLSSLELADMVEQELLENPVLEIEDRKNGDSESVEQELDNGDDKTTLEDYFDWAEYFNDGTDIGAIAVDTEKPSLEAYTSSVVLLQEHLEFQLHLAVLDARTRSVGEYLIGCIDENGYLQGSVAEIAGALQVDEAYVIEVLKIIQTFDPAGVGARDLRECLTLQLFQRGISDKLVIAIVEGYLDEVAAGRYKCIADKLNCTPHQVQQAVDIIRTLDPKPGRAFGTANDFNYIVPDVTIERVNHEYIIIINDSSVPQLTINPYYRRVVQDADGEARKYVEGRINAAVWLIKSIEQRRRTLYSVVEAIIHFQRDFFDLGPKYLRPLTMKKVADRLGIHESTVSRATANKYAATPHGLFALRTFFSAGVHSVGGEDVAASRIKREIKEIIAQEDTAHPLSDQELTDIFARRGIAVSRRTVAKYREELGIAASSKRKRY